MHKDIKETLIPTKTVGPLKIKMLGFDAKIKVPLATFETPLWHSVNRGARVSRDGSGIFTCIVKDEMTRSILLEAFDSKHALKVANDLASRKKDLEVLVATTSSFATLHDIKFEVVGNLLYLRFAFGTGDAAGHNMVTLAAEAILNWILQHYAGLTYVSLSGNYCCDKKVSAVNGILGRGKYVVAEMIVSEKNCCEKLNTTPAAIVNLNIKKNLLGSILAGSIRSANAHFANMLLAFYLATGQDAANIVEGSQGIVHADMRGNDLYFSVTLPNVILGTVGNGKDLSFVQNNLEAMGCLEKNDPGKNAQKLASIAAAVVWCGELSLLAALTESSSLMRSHKALEREQQNKRGDSKISRATNKDG